MHRRLVIVLSLLLSTLAFAHDSHTEKRNHESALHYLGNAGVMVAGASKKILFDPFFHNHFGQYTLVPESIRDKLFANEPPYDNIDALFVSHMHEDHFDAEDTIKYLLMNTSAQVFLPEQARGTMTGLDGFADVKERIVGVDRALGQEALTLEFDDLIVEAIYIPHSGWPNRSFVQNIVFRVSSRNEFTVMHFGDAIDDVGLYQTHEQFWQDRRTQVGLIPFWLGLTADGRTIINDIINVERNIGVHVPSKGYPALNQLGIEHFLVPAETKTIRR